MKLSAFNLPHFRTQLFLTTYGRKADNKPIRNIIIDHNASLVAVIPESELIIKFIKARSWHEYLKLLWNHSRVTKEIKGCSLLKNLGLCVPTIYEVGYGVIPSTKHKYLGYYIMENLTHSGFQELSKLITQEIIDKEVRNKIMSSIHDGLKVMKDNHIIFSDFHLDNIFANNNGEITWIDTGVTTYSTFKAHRFNQKFNHSIKRYINYEYGGKTLLSQSEKAMFSDLLITSTEN
jgi:tRNA A-37 threonylcarbamoyl transferase component Bud32